MDTTKKYITGMAEKTFPEGKGLLVCTPGTYSAIYYKDASKVPPIAIPNANSRWYIDGHTATYYKDGQSNPPSNSLSNTRTSTNTNLSK